jgi:5-methyltetrahydrofolate corrinoid/iron sulfur protein methyltransferase
MIVIADNLNALNPVVSRAMDKLDHRPIQKLALKCLETGADYIDINPGYLPKGREDRMTFLVEAVQKVTNLGIILDSPNPGVLAKGLKACQGKPIINALTLEETKIKEILPLAVEYQSPLILLLLDDRSRSPNTLEEKTALAVELREKVVSAGVPEEQLIFDPLMPHLSWPDASVHLNADLNFIRLASSGVLFNGPTNTVMGLSNLYSGYKGEEVYQKERTCMTLLSGAGLGHVLLNVFRPELMGEVTRIRQFTKTKGF